MVTAWAAAFAFEAAITASNSMANTIVECATAVAPDAIDEIEAAFSRAMNDGGSSSYSSVSVGGAFLISPTAPAGSPPPETVTKIIKVTKSTVKINSPDPSPSK